MNSITKNQNPDMVQDIISEINNSCRAQCLWHFAKDYYPETDEERIRILHYIESHGNLELFRQAKNYERWLWLLLNSSEISAK